MTYFTPSVSLRSTAIALLRCPDFVYAAWSAAQNRPLRQQMLPLSATGGGRIRCPSEGAFVGQPQGLSLRYVVVCFVSFATAFGCLSLTMQLLLFRKNHARLACSVVNALTTARCRYQLLRIIGQPQGLSLRVVGILHSVRSTYFFSLFTLHSSLFTLLCPIGHSPLPTLFRIQLKSSGVLPRAAMGSAYAPFIRTSKCK